VKSESFRLLEDDWNAVRDLASMFRYFVRNRKYGYVDRLANAYNPRVAEITIREALREARSAFDQNEKVHLPSEDNVKRVIELINKDLSIAGLLAALSLAFPEKRGG